MAIVQAKYFVLANGNRPTNCSVDDGMMVSAEVILSIEYPPNEEITMLNLVISDTSNTCIKRFRWYKYPGCLIKPGVTYTIDTPVFGPLLTGTYKIAIDQTRGLQYNKGISECGISLAEINCIAPPLV